MSDIVYIVAPDSEYQYSNLSGVNIRILVAHVRILDNSHGVLSLFVESFVAIVFKRAVKRVYSLVNT